MICSSPLFFSSLGFSCLLVRSLVCRSVGCYFCGFKDRVCRGFSLLELALVFASPSPFLCFQPGPLEFFPGFLVALFQCFVLGLTLLTRVLGDDCKNMILLPGSPCSSRFLRFPLVSFHDKHDLPTFCALLLWRSPGPSTVSRPSCLHARFVQLRSLDTRWYPSAVGLWTRWEPTCLLPP